MQGTLESFLLVLASEMGDKTQLLALLLAARFQKPWTIMLGILAATLINHAMASWAGMYLAGLVDPTLLRWALAVTFFGFAAWVLIPDKDEGLASGSRTGAFMTTLIAFFLAEMGDKTQLATVALGAKFAAPVAVTFGTTMGMLVADGLAVFFGRQLTARVSMTWIRRVAAALFFIFGVCILVGF